ncbi:MAG TPA: WYL domain-containing protein [Kofleriaceae bacterium]|nr:WYL domain-containing protein [Kofleriaceae bacterium]
MYKRGDLRHISRALRVLDELRGFRRGRRLSELARLLGASERTIRRDLGDLRSAGFEIESVTIEGRAAARLVERTYSNIAITRRERYTLLAVASLFDVLRGTPLWEDVSSLQHKLEQRMSPEERAEHAQLGDRFAYVPDGGTKAYEGKEDILDALLTGVLSRRVVRFSYRDARGRAGAGYLAPFTMILYKHGLYVVGCRLREPADGRALGEAHARGVGIPASEPARAAPRDDAQGDGPAPGPALPGAEPSARGAPRDSATGDARAREARLSVAESATRRSVTPGSGDPAGRPDARPDAPIGIYAVERFVEAEPLRNAPFATPPGFRITELLNGAFGIHVTTDSSPHRVVVEFSAERAAFVRARVWHPTQIFEELSDRRVRLTFTCASLVPVVSWVLEWGPHARAIEPPALVASVIAELDAARRNYA